jgi:hypothetical protein
MTASRARSSDIGSERENSRIGTRCVSAFELPGLVPLVLEPPDLEEFFRVIMMIRNPAMQLFFLHCNKHQWI